MNIIEATAPWLTVLVAIPFVSGLVLWLVPQLRTFARQFALAISVLVLAGFVAALATSFDMANAGTTQLYESYPWIPQIGVSLTWGINGMGAVMIGLAVLLVPFVILAEWEDFDAREDSGYFAWVLVLEAVMIGLFAARDVFLFYVLFEAMIVPVYFMIGRYGGTGRVRAAMKFLLFSLAGGLIMLAGIIAVYAYGQGGSEAFILDHIQGTLRLSDTAQMWVFLSFFTAFAIKAPMWPVHTWLPDTAASASTGTSTLLVGILDKLGTFGMIAICLPLFPRAVTVAAPVVLTLAIISIIWGALMAISSDNLLRLVSYTSISHFGFMVMGIFSGSALALTGSILYMVAHGIGTAGLFLIVGFLERRGHSYLISSYGGWQRVTPIIAGTFLIAGLATIALPGLSGFIPEYLVLMGTYSVWPVVALCAVIGVVLAAIYILLPYQRAFTGPKPDIEVQDMGGREKVVAGGLIVAMLALGFYPAPVLEMVSPVADNATIIPVTVTDNTQVSIEGSDK
ncbi:NADH-quinone oxidoreductase subunit M [Arcanobacterium phocae]|uniref:NADH-quinone oxidoreductase subunit M n=1 Tax=Arcanobacterium phocae TaxID=131112 RepID=UPI001C0E97C6|nr:NADH-quinone oxidoreductase subunit M [Arcanobacterium phocae]